MLSEVLCYRQSFYICCSGYPLGQMCVFYAETACIDHNSHKAIKIFYDKKHIEQPYMKSVSLWWLTEEQCWKYKYITKTEANNNTVLLF